MVIVLTITIITVVNNSNFDATVYDSVHCCSAVARVELVFVVVISAFMVCQKQFVK